MLWEILDIFSLQLLELELNDSETPVSRTVYLISFANG